MIMKWSLPLLGPFWLIAVRRIVIEVMRIWFNDDRSVFEQKVSIIFFRKKGQHLKDLGKKDADVFARIHCFKWETGGNSQWWLSPHTHTRSPHPIGQIDPHFRSIKYSFLAIVYRTLLPVKKKHSNGYIVSVVSTGATNVPTHTHTHVLCNLGS